MHKPKSFPSIVLLTLVITALVGLAAKPVPAPSPSPSDAAISRRPQADSVPGPLHGVLEPYVVISPNGKWQVINQCDVGTCIITLKDLETRQEKVITPAGSDIMIAFSPDSRLLAYSEHMTKLYDAVTGSTRTILAEQFSHPLLFTPDGLRLVLIVDVDGHDELFVSNLDGKTGNFIRDRSILATHQANDGTAAHIADGGTTYHWEGNALVWRAFDGLEYRTEVN